LILLDVMMPGMDGIEVCRRIKAMPQWQPVQIIMVTALTEPEDLARCLSAGANDFVGKPINGVELRARVESMLRIKKQFDRIESLSKLQRQNIQELEKDLGTSSQDRSNASNAASEREYQHLKLLDELRQSLGMSFANESLPKVTRIIDNIDVLKNNLYQLDGEGLLKVLNSMSTTAIDLNKTLQSLSFYLQLAATPRDRSTIRFDREFCQQLVMPRVVTIEPTPKLAFNIESIELPISLAEMNFVIGEVLGDIFSLQRTADLPVFIGGRSIDRLYCFWIGMEANLDANTKAQLAESIRAEKGQGDRRLTTGLKIVKKIVELHGGIFSIVHPQPDRKTIYITLPLSIKN
jgi:two-component system, sensor histidine kinase and response regulator